MQSTRTLYFRPQLALPAILLGFSAVHASARPDSNELMDRLELTELTHRYARAIDTQDRELLARVFTSDAKAHYVEVGPQILGLDGRLDEFDEIWEWLHEGLGHRKGPAGLP